jgi:threonine dehydratase
LVTIEDIRAAAGRVAPVIVRTPLISSPVLDDIAAGRVFLKAENLQRTGSFKIRGAYNLLSQLTPEQAKNGAVAYSSGNHAQAVAAAGTMLGIETTIVMPEDSPQIKIENTRKLGGTTVLYDRYSEDREEIARSIVAERGATLVPPYDHEHIIAGQGTAGLEIMEQSEEQGVTPDQVLVSCSGGGLTAGCSVAVNSLSPQTGIYPVEPEDFDDTRRSLQSGQFEGNDPEARTICDSLMSSPPGKVTFPINRELATAVLTVSDDEVCEAIRFAFRNLKLVVEAGGAVSLAAILAGKIETKGKVTAAILSGGNIDTKLYASILQAG